MNLIVRRADPADLDLVAPLFDAYRRFYGQPADLARARTFLGERLKRGESTILLALHEERAVGFTQLYPMFSSVRTARIWILNDLFVDASARRLGVARRLLDAAAQFATGQGAAGLMLETSRDNAPARALYRAAGWSEEASQWYSLALMPAAAQSADACEALFAYGTLQDHAVQQALFGRLLDGSADAVDGFRLGWLEPRAPDTANGAETARYPIVHATGSAQDRVPGTLLQLTRDELQRADDYEADDYRRVQVTLASGREAWLYVAAAHA